MLHQTGRVPRPVLPRLGAHLAHATYESVIIDVIDGDEAGHRAYVTRRRPEHPTAPASKLGSLADCGMLGRLRSYATTHQQ